MSQPPAKTNLLAEQPASAAKLSAFDFMSSDRPLDALLPQLKDSYIPFAPIHPRLLEMADDPTDAQWVMLWWGDLANEPLLFRQLAKLVEATLLAELSRTPEQRRGRNPRYTGLHLLQRDGLLPGIGHQIKVLAEQQRDQVDPEPRHGEAELLGFPGAGVAQELHHKILSGPIWCRVAAAWCWPLTTWMKPSE